MDIRNWITFEDGRQDDQDEGIAAAAQESLAKLVQQRLRAQIDPGIDLRSARRAQSISATYADGQITIGEDDQAKVLDGQQGEDLVDAEPPAGNLEDLFRPGSGVPESITGQDGSSTLVFRSISAANLFNHQVAGNRAETIERAITDTLRSNLVESIENSMREAKRHNPGSR